MSNTRNTLFPLIQDMVMDGLSFILFHLYEASGFSQTWVFHNMFVTYDNNNNGRISIWHLPNAFHHLINKM